MPFVDKQVAIPVRGYKTSVSFHDCGNPEAPTILALHGFTGSGPDFEQLRHACSNKALNWICPDFMGHGGSQSPEVLDPYMLGAALHLIDRARLLAPNPLKVLLLAYSMGGRLALHYLRHAVPLPAILIGTSPGLESPEERLERRHSDQKWMDRLSGPIDAFCSEWEQQPLIRPQAQIAEPYRTNLAKRRRANSPTGLRHSLAACGTGVLPSLWGQLDKLSGIILCHGSEDARFAAIAQAMGKANSRFLVREVPGCGHSPHLEAPEAMATVLEDGMDSILYR